MCVHTFIYPNPKPNPSPTYPISTTSLASHTQIHPCHPLVASSKLKPDMVLEDVESDNEGQQKCKNQPSAAAPSTSMTPPSPTVHQQQGETQQTPSDSLQPHTCSDPNPQPESVTESATKMSQEDAETQTGRWTPFIESIKKEAEDVALANMEER